MPQVRTTTLLLVFVGMSVLISVLTITGSIQKLLQHNSRAVKDENMEKTLANIDFWKTVELESEDLPSNINETATQAQVESKTVNIMGIETFYRESQPPEGVVSSGEVVVLLHGAKFSSENWKELDTIGILAAMGHRVVAPDLPGYGETSKVEPGDKADFLQELFTKLEITKPILISPSMSGSYSIPFVIKYPQDLSGYVPIAPVDSEKLKANDPELMIPTLITYGELDMDLGHKSREVLFSRIPTSQIVPLPDANHDAYRDQPVLFHTLLYNFIKNIHARKA
ncbi:protein ABHD14B-like [Penaeus japonicus]|uniref:protein ABHD14B-like n=1 Tax=Penaeus japonicus TaxID=27405 RepID=UPI001C70ED5C|nr:protein ABHD14B-like [Penaeus japonicus]